MVNRNPRIGFEVVTHSGGIAEELMQGERRRDNNRFERIFRDFCWEWEGRQKSVPGFGNLCWIL